jgi:hypothetical protein
MFTDQLTAYLQTMQTAVTRQTHHLMKASCSALHSKKGNDER